LSGFPKKCEQKKNLGVPVFSGPLAFEKKSFENEKTNKNYQDT